MTTRNRYGRSVVSEVNRRGWNYVRIFTWETITQLSTFIASPTLDVTVSIDGTGVIQSYIHLIVCVSNRRVATKLNTLIGAVEPNTFIISVTVTLIIVSSTHVVNTL